jgi:hypothetical protein
MTIPEPQRSLTSDSVSTHLPQAVAALNLRQPNPRNTTKDVEKSASEGFASGGIDSGYASAAGTPITSVTPEKSRTLDAAHTFPQDLLPEEGRRRLYPAAKAATLKVFDKPIPQPVQNRFEDLNELFGKALILHLLRAKMGDGDTRSISTKLKYVGSDEVSARPCVVILCNKNASRKVRQFFNSKAVKSHYQPTEPSFDVPHLDIKVCDRPPKPIASIADIYGSHVVEAGELPAVCGTPFGVVESGVSHFGTIGGLVMVTTMSGSVTLYGLSAGHVISRGRPKGPEDFRSFSSESPEVLDIDESFDDDGESFDSDTFDLDLEFEHGYDSTQTETNIVQGHSNLAKPRIIWIKMGHILQSSTSDGFTQGMQNYDWSLIAIDDLMHCDISSFLNQKSDARNQKMASCFTGKTLSHERQVVAFCGMSSRKEGHLAATMSHLVLGPGEGFVKTYNLKISDGTSKSSPPSTFYIAHILLNSPSRW